MLKPNETGTMAEAFYYDLKPRSTFITFVILYESSWWN